MMPNVTLCWNCALRLKIKNLFSLCDVHLYFMNTAKRLKRFLDTLMDTKRQVSIYFWSLQYISLYFTKSRDWIFQNKPILVVIISYNAPLKYFAYHFITPSDFPKLDFFLLYTLEKKHSSNTL